MSDERCQCGADGKGPCAPGCAWRNMIVRTAEYATAGYATGTTYLIPVYSTPLLDADVEWYAWPLVPRGGQHTNMHAAGCMAYHKPTQIAVTCESERSRMKNRERALERLRVLVQRYGADLGTTTEM